MLALAALFGLGGGIAFGIGKANQPGPGELQGGSVADVVTTVGGICLATAALVAALALWRLYRALSSPEDGS